MLAIQKAEYIRDYKIQLAFNNGETGIANLKQTLKKDSRTLFIELQNIDNFQRFSLQHDTIAWPNGLDLAPEYLFYLAFMHEEQWQEKFRAWGYK